MIGGSGAPSATAERSTGSHEWAATVGSSGGTRPRLLLHVAPGHAGGQRPTPREVPCRLQLVVRLREDPGLLAAGFELPWPDHGRTAFVAQVREDRESQLRVSYL